jgi:hypothetical protein
LGRLIKTEPVGKERKQLIRAIVVALRELSKSQNIDKNSRDLSAFIALALMNVYKTIDISVVAWEKRDYWVKADRFRMEWIWTKQTADSLAKALLEENWEDIPVLLAQVGSKFSNEHIPVRHGIGSPWIGAWERLKVEASQK